jgi:hypothetical protein
MATIDDLQIRNIERTINAFKDTVNLDLIHERLREFDRLRRNIEEFGGIQKLKEASERFEEFKRIQEIIGGRTNLKHLNDIASIIEDNKNLFEPLKNTNALISGTLYTSFLDNTFIEHIRPRLDQFRTILDQNNFQVQETIKQLHCGLETTFRYMDNVIKASAFSHLQAEIVEASNILNQNKPFLEFIEEHRQEITNQIFHLTEFVREGLKIEEIGQLLGEQYIEDVERNLETLESETDKFDWLSTERQRVIITLLCVFFIFFIEAIQKAHEGKSLDALDLIKFALHIIPIIYGLYHRN